MFTKKKNTSWPGRDKSSPFPYKLSFNIHFNIVPTSSIICLKSFLPSWVFRLKFCVHLLPVPCILYAQHFLSCLSSQKKSCFLLHTYWFRLSVRRSVLCLWGYPRFTSISQINIYQDFIWSYAATGSFNALYSSLLTSVCNNWRYTGCSKRKKIYGKENATAHTVTTLLAYWQFVFNRQLIANWVRPPRSPYFKQPNFFSRGL